MIHTSAATLYRALLDDAAHAPPDDSAHILPDWRPADAGEPADMMALPMVEIPHSRSRGAISMAIADDARERAEPMVAMHGPSRPHGKLWATYTYSANPGVRSSIRVRATRPRLLAMAETVRKNWALYGGGAKPAELAPKRRARTWPASIIGAWRAALEDLDYTGAVLAGERLGAMYFEGANGSAFAFAAPIQIEGLPDGFCSARRCDGDWVVADMRSGMSIGAASGRRRYGSRAAAESAAIEEWSGMADDCRADRLRQCAAIAESLADPDTRRAAWCRAHGIDDPLAAEQAAPVEQAAPELAQVAPEPAAPPVAQSVHTPCSAIRAAVGPALVAAPPPSPAIVSAFSSAAGCDRGIVVGPALPTVPGRGDLQAQLARRRRVALVLRDARAKPEERHDKPQRHPQPPAEARHPRAALRAASRVTADAGLALPARDKRHDGVPVELLCRPVCHRPGRRSTGIQHSTRAPPVAQSARFTPPVGVSVRAAPTASTCT